MTDYSELKRLADNYASLIDSEDRDLELEARDLFQDAARVDIVQSLIGRLEVSERMEGLYTSTVTVERAELEQTKRERDQLKAEIERLSKQLCMCPSCHGQGEVFAGSHSYQGHFPPPEPDMDKCWECDGDGVIGTPVDLAAALDEIERLKGGQGEPFMYGIAQPDGKPHYSELCVSGEASDLESEVESMNEDSVGYRVVALYTSQPAPVSVVNTSIVPALVRNLEAVIDMFTPLDRTCNRTLVDALACLDKVKELNK